MGLTEPFIVPADLEASNASDRHDSNMVGLNPDAAIMVLTAGNCCVVTGAYIPAHSELKPSTLPATANSIVTSPCGATVYRVKRDSFCVWTYRTLALSWSNIRTRAVSIVPVTVPAHATCTVESRRGLLVSSHVQTHARQAIYEHPLLLRYLQAMHPDHIQWHRVPLHIATSPQGLVLLHHQLLSDIEAFFTFPPPIRNAPEVHAMMHKYLPALAEILLPAAPGIGADETQQCGQQQSAEWLEPVAIDMPIHTLHPTEVHAEPSNDLAPNHDGQDENHDDDDDDDDEDEGFSSDWDSSVSSTSSEEDFSDHGEVEVEAAFNGSVGTEAVGTIETGGLSQDLPEGPPRLQRAFAFAPPHAQPPSQTAHTLTFVVDTGSEATTLSCMEDLLQKMQDLYNMLR